MTDQFRRCTCERQSGWSRFRRGEFFLVQFLLQDPFDGYVCWIVEAQSTDASSFEPLWAKPFAQPQQSSRGAQPILGTVVLIIIQEFLITEYPLWYQLLFGLILIVSVVWLRGGLVELIERVYWWAKIEWIKLKMRVTMWWREWREA